MKAINQAGKYFPLILQILIPFLILLVSLPLLRQEPSQVALKYLLILPLSESLCIRTPSAVQMEPEIKLMLIVIVLLNLIKSTVRKKGKTKSQIRVRAQVSPCRAVPVDSKRLSILINLIFQTLLKSLVVPLLTVLILALSPLHMSILQVPERNVKEKPRPNKEFWTIKLANLPNNQS